MRVFCPVGIGIWRCWFLYTERGKPEKPERNPRSKARIEPTTNSTHIWHRAGVEPGSQGESALTATPTLPPLYFSRFTNGDVAPLITADYLAIVLHGQFIFRNSFGLLDFGLIIPLPFDLLQVYEHAFRLAHAGLVRNSWKSSRKKKKKKKLLKL